MDTNTRKKHFTDKSSQLVKFGSFSYISQKGSTKDLKKKTKKNLDKVLIELLRKLVVWFLKKNIIENNFEKTKKKKQSSTGNQKRVDFFPFWKQNSDKQKTLKKFV